MPFNSVSRRSLLAGASASAALATLPLVGKRAFAATPKQGGHLRIGHSNSSSTFTMDPLTHLASAALTLSLQVRNCLVEIDHEGNAIPELADSWEGFDGAKKWLFKLRPGVEFHNGKTLDVNDVIWSINYHRGEGSKSPIKGNLDQIKELKADGNNLIVELKGGNADFPYTMSALQLTIGIDGWTASDWEEGIGTGGYMLESIEPGVRLLTKKNPNYWKDGRAHFDSIETRAINNSTARINAIRTKQVDVIDAVDLQLVDRLKQDSSINIVSVEGLAHADIPMWTDTAPFDNVEVRLAMKHAIDRQEMVDKILQGYGSVGNDHPISSNLKFFPKDLPQREYDPDKSRFLLKKAGYEGLSLELPAADGVFPGAVDFAILFKQQAERAGINVTVRRAPDDGYWNNVWMKVPICVSRFNTRPTVDETLSVQYLSTAAWNDTHWGNDRFDALVRAARAELDASKRTGMYREAITLLRDNGGSITPFFYNNVDAATVSLQHGTTSGMRPLDGCRATERWWFEA